MIKLIRHKDVYGIGFFLLLVTLIGYQEMISPAIGIFSLVVLVEGVFLKSLRFVFTPSLLLFIGLYLFYLVGLLWSDHPDVGWKLLEYKMSFFIFPILFCFQKMNSDVELYLRGLVWGALLLTARFFYERYTHEAGVNFYDISRSDLKLHPTYASIYFASALVFLCIVSVKKKVGLHLIPSIGAMLLFAFMILATGSLSGILFLGLLIATGIGILVRIYLKKIALAIYIGCVPVLIYFALTHMKSMAYDLEVLKQVKTEILEGKTSFIEKNKVTVSGNVERVLLWLISSEIIAENPFGVGTGDIDYHLQAKCDEHGLLLLKEQNLNPHNQYLQIGIDLGIPGIIYLLFCLVWFLVKGIHARDWFLVITVASLFFNALFESVLQRQSGIVFYTLLICILLIMGKTWQKAEAKQL